MDNRIVWPEVFEVEDISVFSDNLLLAQALTAWGHIMAGNKPPSNFGDVMATIAQRLNVAGTPDSLMALANKVNNTHDN